MEWMTDPAAWAAVLALTALEIVLGVDNVVFISILAGKLRKEEQAKAWKLGLGLALGLRVLLLLALGWVMRLDQVLFSPLGHPVTGKELILFIGGLFLIWKAVKEIHEKLEGDEGHISGKVAASLGAVVVQISIINIVFSLDSVITAIGMVDEVALMIIAVVASTILMLIFGQRVGHFVERHPTLKMLALAFLVLIGVNLIAEGAGQTIPKGYTYFAMAFAIGVEMLNQRIRAKSEPVHLRSPIVEDSGNQNT
ncbi:MAG: TerC family protein [Armatimonadota bacterium]|nr:TerC family protein [Armatimonadota bacterium]